MKTGHAQKPLARKKRFRKNLNSDDHFDRSFAPYRDESQTTKPKERNNNESTDSVQKNTNSITSDRTGARRARIAAVARADAVLDWNGYAANAIVGVARHAPPRGLIRLAMVHVAIYDAVDAIAGYPFTPYAVTPNVVTPASPEAATAAAATTC